MLNKDGSKLLLVYQAVVIENYFLGSFEAIMIKL